MKKHKVERRGGWFRNVALLVAGFVLAKKFRPGIHRYLRMKRM